MDAPGLEQLRRDLRRLLPPGVAVAISALAGPLPPLAAPERASTARMSALRLREFTAGRAVARQALAELGLPAAVIPRGSNRAPDWPAGFVGSISHTDGVVAAVVAPAALLVGIGLDIEPAEPLEPALVDRVCRPGELAGHPGDPARALRARLHFSAKESVYKCIAPRTGIFLEFEDLAISADDASGRFTALGLGPGAAALDGPALTGAFVASAGYWVTAAWQLRRAPQA